MRKIIISTFGCTKCKMLHEQVPDAEVLGANMDLILPLARALDIKYMPIVVMTGEVDELAEILKGKENETDAETKL